MSFLKNFNKSAKEYLTHQNSENTFSLLDNFKLLFTSEVNWHSLEPGNRETLDFFVNLYELMRCHDENSDITWAILNALEDIIKHSELKECLIHTFKFVPELTKLLKTKPFVDNKLKILMLIQELTYGIKISWQEAHLPFLISSLTKWITGDEPPIIPLALGILVNLCYKNTPSVYTLMKSVDIKQFLKVLFKLQKKSAQSKVQVCKLLIILEDISGGIPDAEMEIYIRTTCPTLAEAINVSNPALMKHIINFFKEIVHSERVTKVIIDYSNYAEDIEKLLNIVNEKKNLNPECLAALFDYLCTVIELKVFGLEALYPQMVRLASGWIDVDTASSDALVLISKIVANLFSKKEDIPSEQQTINDCVSQFLEGKLPEIIHLLNSDESSNSNFKCNTDLTRLTSLILLLSKLVQFQTFSALIINYLDKSVFIRLFDPLLEHNFKENDLFQKPVYTFYVEALCFITALAVRETSWLLLYNDLLQQSQVQMVLATALFTGSKKIKEKVLTLTGAPGFSSDCLALLADQMTKLNKLVSVSTSNMPHQDTQNSSSNNTSNISPLDVMPLLTITQQGHLNSVLEKCEQAARKNEDTLTSSIMELYHYRMSLMEQSQRQAQASQEAADLRAAQLQAKLAQSSAELGHLHHLHYLTQQSLEHMNKESASLTTQLNAVRLEAQETQNKYSQCKQNLSSKTLIITSLNQEVDQLKLSISKSEKDLKSLQEELNKKNMDYSELSSELVSSKESNATLKKNLTNLVSSLETMKKESESKSQRIDSLNKEVAELTKELSELKRMQEIISELAMGKRKI